MIRNRLLQTLAVVVLSYFTATAHANVNVQVIPFANGCKGAIIYNNSNHVLEITVSYIYEGKGGSYYSGSTTPVAVQPRSNWTHSWLYHGPVDCSKPYTVRTNYTYIDKTIQAQHEAGAERKRQEQFLRDQQRRNDEAGAARKQRNEEFLREREARLEKEREAHERMVQRARSNPHWEGGCPPGQHCKPLHLPAPSNPNQDTSARVYVVCQGITYQPGRALDECRQIEARNRLADEERRTRAEARSAAEDAARAREYEETSKRLSANPCAVTEGELRFRPPQPTHTNPRQQAAMVAQQTAQRAQMLSHYMRVCVDRDPCAAADILARLEPAKLRSTMTANYPIRPIPASATPQQRDAAEKQHAALDRYREEMIAYTTKMIAMLESSPPAALDRARSACTASRNPPPPAAPYPAQPAAGYPYPPNATPPSYPAPYQGTPPAYPNQYPAPQPATPTAQTADPCENLRKAFENDKNNLLLAYQLRRCIKKNRQAVQAQ